MKVDGKADTLFLRDEAQTNVSESLENRLVLLKDLFGKVAVFKSNKPKVGEAKVCASTVVF